MYYDDIYKLLTSLINDIEGFINSGESYIFDEFKIINIQKNTLLFKCPDKVFTIYVDTKEKEAYLLLNASIISQIPVNNEFCESLKKIASKYGGHNLNS